MASQEELKCSACGGRLVEADDYIFRQAVRTAAGTIPYAAVICAVWAPVFFLIRLIIGGSAGEAGSGIAMLLLGKVFTGAVIGVLIGAATAFSRTDFGLLIGAVIGVLGGFFIAAAAVMPLKADAAHRVDVVLVSVLSGVLCVATMMLAERRAKAKFSKWIGPEIKGEL